MFEVSDNNCVIKKNCNYVNNTHETGYYIKTGGNYNTSSTWVYFLDIKVNGNLNSSFKNMYNPLLCVLKR